MFFLVSGLALFAFSNMKKGNFDAARIWHFLDARSDEKHDSKNCLNKGGHIIGAISSLQLSMRLRMSHEKKSIDNNKPDKVIALNLPKEST